MSGPGPGGPGVSGPPRRPLRLAGGSEAVVARREGGGGVTVRERAV